MQQKNALTFPEDIQCDLKIGLASQSRINRLRKERSTFLNAKHNTPES
jgi:hypothetical protein